MPLSPEMNEKLVARLTAVDGFDIPIHTVGPDLRCATVEDAERLVQRIAAWQVIFHDLRATSTLEEDRSIFDQLAALWSDVADDLAPAIRAAREDGVSWEATKDIVAAREITGVGTIDPRIAIVTSHGEPQ
jgi:hypothetical protein